MAMGIGEKVKKDPSSPKRLFAPISAAKTPLRSLRVKRESFGPPGFIKKFNTILMQL